MWEWNWEGGKKIRWEPKASAKKSRGEKKATVEDN